jgi:hypothetical protein
MPMTTLAREERLAEVTFDRVEALERIATSLPEGDERRDELDAMVTDFIQDLGAVRPRVAGALLGVSEKTVRAWVEEGVLDAVALEPRLLLEPVKLHQVSHVVRELREAGQTRGLLDAVFRRLADQALLDSEELQTGLAQMRRREGRLVRSKSTTRA